MKQFYSSTSRHVESSQKKLEFEKLSDDWEIAELSKDRVVITVSRCPYPFTRDEVCRAHTCMEQALVATLDDSLDYRIGRSIPQGDVCCEHILSVKERKLS